MIIDILNCAAVVSPFFFVPFAKTLANLDVWFAYVMANQVDLLTGWQMEYFGLLRRKQIELVC